MKILSSILAASVVTISVQAADKQIDFAKEIQPILEKSCIQCHGPDKHKGDLRLDSKEAALKGGKDALALVPGDIAKSDLYRRITLPKDHDDVMPSKGDLLTKVQTDLIRDWISQGANWPAGLVIKSTAAPEEIKAEPVKLPEYKPGAAELKAVAKFGELGVAVRPIALNVNWREANFRSLNTNATDAALAPLKDILGLVDLNLAGTKISDSGLASIKGLTNLTHLHLEHTQIGDAGLVNLKGLVNLEYLNLFDTKVSDAGLENLKGLARLKNLHLWQTKVTDTGVTNLQKSLPKLNIVRGWELAAVAKKEAEPAKKEPEAPVKQAEPVKKEVEAPKKEPEPAKKPVETPKAVEPAKKPDEAPKAVEPAKKVDETPSKEAGALRKEAEALRKEAEALRKEGEASKKEAEALRKEAEAAKK
ncbi:MAG: c-type cytochrome domain-containing protein [Verrucomicrobiota bacterium]